MRSLVAVLVALMALPVAAEDQFSLGLTELDFSAEDATDTPDGVDALVTDEVPPERAEMLAFKASLRPRTAKERAQALWNSDLAKVYYSLAAQQAMLGREGLVNGGRMTGVGMGTAGIGDGDPNGALGVVVSAGDPR
jgi:hypothetical protein